MTAAQKVAGWGLAGEGFYVDDGGTLRLCRGYGDGQQGRQREKDHASFSSFVPWAENVLGIDIDEAEESGLLALGNDGQRRLERRESADAAKFASLMSPTPHPGLSKFASALPPGIDLLTDILSRLRRSHGHSCQEIYALRRFDGPRAIKALGGICDGVVLPSSSQDVVAVVKAARESNTVLVPYGGGTSVTGALLRPRGHRCVVAVDMQRMQRIVVDRDNSVVHAEAGASGAEIERQLSMLGLVLGHEPDSMEFSTVGGWIATKASGMKARRYGNIEDIVVSATLVTPEGSISIGDGNGKSFPRTSTGPDVARLAIGSEGTLGIVTVATLRVREAPQVSRHSSAVFRSFEDGVSALRDMAAQGLCPASVRLIDETQFQFARALKPDEPPTLTSRVLSRAAEFYVTRWHGMDPNALAAMTIKFEGTSDEVGAQERALRRIVSRRGGAWGDSSNGERGYFLTFMIAHLRDFALDLGFLAESFETSVAWTDVSRLCAAVKARIAREAADAGVVEKPFATCRVSQSYETGACVYFYFGILERGLSDPTGVFTRIEHAARECVLAHGGSLSHHHGIGKARKEWFRAAKGDLGMRLLRHIKSAVDPDNVFGSGNLFDAATSSKL